MDTIREDFYHVTAEFHNVDRSVLTEETNLDTLSILSIYLNEKSENERQDLVVSKEGIKTDFTQEIESIMEMYEGHGVDLKFNIKDVIYREPGKEDKRLNMENIPVCLDISDLFAENKSEYGEWYDDELHFRWNSSGLLDGRGYHFGFRTRIFIDDIQDTFEVELLEQDYNRFKTLGDVLNSLEKSLEKKRISEEESRLLGLLNQNHWEQLKNSCKKLNLHKIPQKTMPSEEQRIKEIEFMQIIRDIFFNDYGEKLDEGVVFQIYKELNEIVRFKSRNDEDSENNR